MEHKPIEVSHDDDDNSAMKEAMKSSHSGKTDLPRTIPSSPGRSKPANMENWKGAEIVTNKVPAEQETSLEVNLEASMTTDDVIRAGGFGARDDMSSFLPVASDSTDFEESILNAKDYEELQEEVHRPGLGWRESEDRK